MFTRQDYLNSCGEPEAFRRYYGEIVEEAGVKVSQDLVKLTKEALDGGDTHLNSIPLSRWDVAASFLDHRVTKALKDRGDFLTLAGGVCILKEAAIRQAEA